VLESLRNAEAEAIALFEDAKIFIQPGMKESELNHQVHLLAEKRFGKYWHKRIVRAGKNTLCPYAENPPDLAIQADDIVFFDFGPVLGEWEADLGRTYVLGDDPEKHQLTKDIEECWHLAKTHFDANPTITGAQLFDFVRGLAAGRGWKYGIEHAGHRIGRFPHEKIIGDARRNYIHPDNKRPMRGMGEDGHSNAWILELHFVSDEFGAFFEQLL
jgi:Xaa-Pro dipeptidase